MLGFYAVSFALVLAMAFTAHLGAVFLPVAGLLLLHLAWQGASLSMDRPERALGLFKSNREAGLILFAAILAGALSAGHAPL